MPGEIYNICRAYNSNILLEIRTISNVSKYCKIRAWWNTQYLQSLWTLFALLAICGEPTSQYWRGGNLNEIKKRIKCNNQVLQEKKKISKRYSCAITKSCKKKGGEGENINKKCENNKKENQVQQPSLAKKKRKKEKRQNIKENQVKHPSLAKDKSKRKRNTKEMNKIKKRIKCNNQVLQKEQWN